MHLSKNLHKVTAQPFVQNKGFAITTLINSFLSPKEGVDLIKR